jgi:hypothetical protein
MCSSVISVVEALISQWESLIQCPLQAGRVEQIKSRFLAGEHGQGSRLAVGDHGMGLSQGEMRVLAKDGKRHVQDQLQAAEFALLFLLFCGSLDRVIFGRSHWVAAI